jgi:hypothetical protein
LTLVDAFLCLQKVFAVIDSIDPCRDGHKPPAVKTLCEAGDVAIRLTAVLPRLSLGTRPIALLVRR